MAYRKKEERWGSYNRFVPTIISGRTLSLRAGAGNAITREVEVNLDRTFKANSLISHGNIYTARVIGLVVGIPDPILFPDIYNSALYDDAGNALINQYYLFALRMEHDYFLNNPSAPISSDANSNIDSQQQEDIINRKTSLIARHGKAISIRSALNFPSVAVGDLVSVQLPVQNSYKGAKVIKVILNNHAADDPLPEELKEERERRGINSVTGRPRSRPVALTAGEVTAPRPVPSFERITQDYKGETGGGLEGGGRDGVIEDTKVSQIKLLDVSSIGNLLYGPEKIIKISSESLTDTTWLRSKTSPGAGYVGALRSSNKAPNAAYKEYISDPATDNGRGEFGDRPYFRYHKGYDVYAFRYNARNLNDKHLLYAPYDMTLTTVSNFVYSGGADDMGVSLTFRMSVEGRTTLMIVREVKLNENSRALPESVRQVAEEFREGSQYIDYGSSKYGLNLTIPAGSPFGYFYYSAGSSRTTPSPLGRIYNPARGLGGGYEANNLRENNNFPGNSSAHTHVEIKIDGKFANTPAVINLEAMFKSPTEVGDDSYRILDSSGRDALYDLLQDNSLTNLANTLIPYPAGP